MTQEQIDKFGTQTIRSLRLERRLLARLLGLLGNPPIAFILWDGNTVEPPGVKGPWRVHLHDRGALWRLVTNPEYEFPEMYHRGRLTVEGDLVRFLEMIHRVRWSIEGTLPTLFTRLHRRRPGSPAQARDNIHRHYDIGNDFYRLWLDRQMVYTCAYFPTPEISLEAAQIAKMDYVCRKLRLRPGERVVEAGCGWGALALHMARHYGVRVRAYNVSEQQVGQARKWSREEGLEDRVEFVLDDYRGIEGEYDVFVSVGMLEHVGPDHYGDLAQVMDRCLTPEGRGLIHSVAFDAPYPMNPWLERYIFPGAQPPSLSQMSVLFEPWGFTVLDLENLRLHYALTLRHWLERFEAHLEWVRERFDDDFIRAWRFYLASTQAAFTTGSMQLFQVCFNRAGNNDVPWTRAYLYRDTD